MLQPVQLTSRQVFTVCFSPTRSLALQVPRALVVSALAAFVHTLLYSLMVKIGGWDTVYANTLGYLLGGVIQYVLSLVWVFSTRVENHSLKFLTFLLLSLVGLGISSGTIWLVNKQLGFDPLLAIIPALGLAFCWNFTSRKYLLFRQ